MRLFLFRHGKVVHMDRFFGQFDNPLSEDGKRQSESIADAVADLDLAAVYTSDLERTAEVGRLISQRTGVPFTKEERLRELHLGWADGLEREEAFERDPELREAKYEDLVQAPLTKGGETIDSGMTQMGGSLPVNPSGGVLSAHAVQAAGLARLAEAVLQLRGEADQRQVEGASVAVAHGTEGACGQGHCVFVLKK